MRIVRAKTKSRENTAKAGFHHISSHWQDQRPAGKNLRLVNPCRKHHEEERPTGVPGRVTGGQHSPKTAAFTLYTGEAHLHREAVPAADAPRCELLLPVVPTKVRSFPLKS